MTAARPEPHPHTPEQGRALARAARHLRVGPIGVEHAVRELVEAGYSAEQAAEIVKGMMAAAPE